MFPGIAARTRWKQRTTRMLAGPADLLRGIAAIHAGTTQKEILRALFDSVAQHSGRTAFFVIKGGTSSGWQGRGFEDNEAIKEFAWILHAACRSVYCRESSFQRANSRHGPEVRRSLRGPAEDQIVMLPLLLKDKVAALVYADGGLEMNRLDTAAMELLVVSTSAWLELTSLRKQTPKEARPYAESCGSRSDGANRLPLQRSICGARAPAYVGGFLSISPISSQSQKRRRPKLSRQLRQRPVWIRRRNRASGATLSEEDADIHRKAQRFARLLVDEIKLYNQAKVAEGRKNKDLYDRLKEDIDKSRATFKKRYGNTAAASVDYLQAELVRSLAEDDITVMGANFRR